MQIARLFAHMRVVSRVAITGGSVIRKGLTSHATDIGLPSRPPCPFLASQSRDTPLLAYARHPWDKGYPYDYRNS